MILTIILISAVFTSLISTLIYKKKWATWNLPFWLNLVSIAILVSGFYFIQIQLIQGRQQGSTSSPIIHCSGSY